MSWCGEKNIIKINLNNEFSKHNNALLDLGNDFLWPMLLVFLSASKKELKSVLWYIVHPPNSFFYPYTYTSFPKLLF